MTALVGADVIQRTFSRQVGQTEQSVTFVADKFAGPLSPESRANFEGPIGGAVFAAFAIIVFILAAQAARGVTAERKGEPPPKWRGSVVWGAIVFVGCAIAVKALLWLFP